MKNTLELTQGTNSIINYDIAKALMKIKLQ